jgi:WD40 repeat protein
VVTSIAFSPDGQVLASNSNDSTIKLWDVNRGLCLKTIKSCNPDEKPYNGMNISNVIGLTESQKTTLKALGAIEDES